MKKLKKYLITDPEYYSNDPIKFKNILMEALSKQHIDYTCFRDKQSENIEELARNFIDTCQNYNIKNIFINQHIYLAKSLGFDGVHLTSLQLEQIPEAKKLGLQTIVSCHTFEDIEKAVELRANMVTYSPIFHSPNKGEPVGINKLKLAIQKYDIPIIALGGIIEEKHLKLLQKVDAKIFASIRYFI